MFYYLFHHFSISILPFCHLTILLFLFKYPELTEKFLPDNP